VDVFDDRQYESYQGSDLCINCFSESLLCKGKTYGYKSIHGINTYDPDSYVTASVEQKLLQFTNYIMYLTQFHKITRGQPFWNDAKNQERNISDRHDRKIDRGCSTGRNGARL
jgi:hypothetical protein